MTTYDLRPLALEQVLPYKSRMEKDGVLFSDKVYYYGLFADEQQVGIYGIRRRGKSGILKCDYTYPNFRRKGNLYKATVMRLSMLNFEGCKTVTANCTPKALGVHRRLGAKIVKRYKNGIVKVIYKL